jgi:hypothetical protein
MLYMKRRNALILAAGGICALAASLATERSRLLVFYRKVKGRLRVSQTPASPAPQSAAELPYEGEKISVELALNSRCSSDSDGDPEIFHWGAIDQSAFLSKKQISRIHELAARCQLPGCQNNIQVDDNVLTFHVNKSVPASPLNSCMISSGMQQQACALACAALGVATTINALGGPDGASQQSGDISAIRMNLNPMKPSYNRRFWTDLAPETERPWLQGNLPDPRRNSAHPLVTAMESVSFDTAEGTSATKENLSQILWATRGRTPHLVKSSPWGLTIPTWQGMQNLSAVYLAAGSKLYKYTSWRKGRPTHFLENTGNSAGLFHRILKDYFPSNCFIVLATNDSHLRSVWEVGYQLLNACLQATALGIAYRVFVVEEGNSSAFADTAIEKPIAVVALKAVEGNSL